MILVAYAGPASVAGRLAERLMVELEGAGALGRVEEVDVSAWVVDVVVVELLSAAVMRENPTVEDRVLV